MIIAWFVAIFVYIFNIFSIIFLGGNDINNILAWVCCVILAGTIIINDKLYKKYRDEEQKALREHINILRETLEIKSKIIEEFEKGQDK